MSFGKMTHGFGLVSALRKGTYSCAEPLAQGAWGLRPRLVLCNARPGDAKTALNRHQLKIFNGKGGDLEPCRMI